MASYRNENRPDSGDLLSWIITIVLLVSPVWPIGLILLLRKLTGGSRRRASRHPILRAYARMEEQGVEGENIRSAKARIEGMMDKVVEGFEKQLDKLFQDDAMDIATDVQVLERMLEKDGLSGGGMTLGG